MRLGVGRRGRAILVLLLFAVVVVVAFWLLQRYHPALATTLLALFGVAGALLVIYEVRVTKQIAQAEFIRNLNDSFTTNELIGELWRKLLLREPIDMSDRHRISAYLTFFETLHLLRDRQVLDFHQFDDLFRNRFFTAIGDRGVQTTALLGAGSSFDNIHQLAEDWHDYLVAKRARIPAGWYAYLEQRTRTHGTDIVVLGPGDLDELLALQAEVIAALADPAWLRANDRAMLEDCLANHVVLGVREAGGLAAAGILVDRGSDEENIQHYFSDDRQLLDASSNLKLILVSPHGGRRKRRLGRTIVDLLGHRAAERGRERVLCTIHPRNAPSIRLFTGLGYRRRGRVSTPYGGRHVYQLEVPRPRFTGHA